LVFFFSCLGACTASRKLQLLQYEGDHGHHWGEAKKASSLQIVPRPVYTNSFLSRQKNIALLGAWTSYRDLKAKFPLEKKRNAKPLFWTRNVSSDGVTSTYFSYCCPGRDISVVRIPVALAAWAGPTPLQPGVTLHLAHIRSELAHVTLKFVHVAQ
jgi:hypothetical protein